MKVFFDNCTPPVLASTLHGYISHYGHSAFHIGDVPGLPRGRDSLDIEWIDHLRSDPGHWMFISADTRVLKNPGERAALRKAGLHGFILAKGFQKMPMQYRAGTLVQRWPELLKVTEVISPPTMHEVPVKNVKLRSFPDGLRA